ncbi:hypothetical protein CR513_35090, partial [Mucuna pruriens]
MPRPADAESEPEDDSPIQQQARPIPLLFPTQKPLARKSEMDKGLLKMFRKVEINILLFDAIKQRKKIRGGAKMGGVVSALTQNKGATARSQSVLPKKCGHPRIFSIPCTIDECTFVGAMLDLGASINVMPASVYKSLNFGDLEPIRMTIQLANRSIVNDLIFLVDFYVLDMEGETFGNGSSLILGCPFLMTAKTKIDVYAGTLSMEFGDDLHPTEDHSLFGIDVIDELVEEHTQLDHDSDEMPSFVKIINVLDCATSLAGAADSIEMSEVLNLYDEEPKYVKLALVPVAETDKPMRAQVATITNVDFNSANQGQAELTRVNRRVSAEMKSSRPDRLRLGQARVVSAVHALQPNKERPNCVVHVSYPPQRQLSCHVTLGESAMSRWKIFTGVE